MALFFLTLLWLGPLVGALLLPLGRRRWVLSVLTATTLGETLIWLWLYPQVKAATAVTAAIPWFTWGQQTIFYALGASPENLWLLLLSILVAATGLCGADANIAFRRAGRFSGAGPRALLCLL
jgi:hypothetical protein